MGSMSTMAHMTDDQMASQYAVIFPEGIPGGVNTDAVTFRMDQSFDPPEDNVATYEIIYRGMKIPKTSMTHDMTKEYNTMVRIDQQWRVHDDLVAWYKRCYDPVNGTALPDGQGLTRTTVLVQMYDGQNVVKKTYRFRGSKLKGYKVETLDNQSTDPLRMTLNFIFTDMITE